MILTDAQKGYLAGLIDGEGSLECQRLLQPRGRTPLFVLRLSFVFATREPLETVCGWIGARWKEYPPIDAIRSSRFRCHIKKRTAVPLLRAVLPFLVLKRRQAELILAIEEVRAANSPSRVHVGHPHALPMLPMPATAVERMDALHAELSSLKSNKRPGRCRRSVV